MRYSSVLRCLVAVSILDMSGAVAVAQMSNQPAADPSPSPHKRQGYFDYVLGKVNPNGNNYGASVETGREALVQHTIDDLYFWSNIVTLLLLTGAAATIFLQWRSSDKKEVIAASLIAELWNGRVSDRIELDNRTHKFNRLVEVHNTDVERALTLKSQPSDKGKDGNGSLSRNVRKMTERGATQLSLDMQTPSEVKGEEQIDLQQNNLMLQRRIEALQNSEQNLKQRLNQTTGLLDQERRRNASLKGA
jgi:hypothetical protein